MVNQIIVDSKQNNKVILANSVDSGSNELIIRWLCDLHRIPRIIIGGETYIPTSEDYLLKIPASMWTGSSYFLVTIKDTRATTELKIYRVADTEGNISMRIMGDNTYRLMKVTSGEVGEYDSFLSFSSVNAVQNKVITQALTEQATNIEELSQEIQEIIGSENNVYYGDSSPANTLGNNKDWYLRTFPQHVITENGYGALSNQTHPIYADAFSESADNVYNFTIHGKPTNNGYGETLWYLLNGLQTGNTYHVSFDLQFGQSTLFTELGNKNTLTIGNALIEFRANESNNHYESDFVYSNNNQALFQFPLLGDDWNFTATITNFTITGQIEFQNGYIELYNKHNNEWVKYYGSGGGSAVQSDWTQTDPNADDYIKNKPTLGTASAKDYTTSVTENDDDLVTSGAVYSAISNLPKAMIFKGTLGNNGTIQILPSASVQNEGYTYKVITAGTYASQSARVGDVFTSNGSEWVLIPSGDETDTDTWRNINVNGSEVLGNGISSGGLDFINGTGLNAVFNSTGNKLQFNVDTDNLAPAFTEASTRANIATGEKLSILFGKIKKFFSDLKTVAFSGSYNDLTDKPTIPSAQVNSDWNATSGIAEILNKPTLATVATSGSYNDLSNKPTIPTVNNATLTIQKNGANVQTFTANQSTNATANITVPTKTSDLTNDSNYVADNPTFTEASTRTNITSGESFATILGKIKKFFTDLKTVAFTGSYNDLTDKPTIPSAQVNSDWNATSGVAKILNKPTIPTVNNGTLTIKKNGAPVQTFTANQSSDVEADITFPDVDDYTIKIGSLGGIGGPTAYYSKCSIVWYDSTNKLLKWISKDDINAYAIDEVSIFSGDYNDLTNKPTIPAAASYGGTGSTTKIKIKINSQVSWMLSFTVTLYQGYKSSKVMVSGYQYGANHWYQPEAVLIADSDGNTSINVYFGYDGTNQLWVGFDGGSYTGVVISDVCNGYTQIGDYADLFTISNVNALTTLQTTVSAKNKVDYASSAGSASTATTATKLGSSNVGSATQPMYLDNGTPTACTYTLGKSVPSNAVFTDTTTGTTYAAGSVPANTTFATNGSVKNVYDKLLNVADNIASGNVYVTFRLGNYTDISFGKTFKYLPMVSVSITIAAGLNTNGYQGCAGHNATNVTNLTTTGCRIWHERADSGANNAYINWIAMSVQAL